MSIVTPISVPVSEADTPVGSVTFCLSNCVPVPTILSVEYREPDVSAANARENVLDGSPLDMMMSVVGPCMATVRETVSGLIVTWMEPPESAHCAGRIGKPSSPTTV